MSCYGLNIDREKHPIHSDDDSVWISFILQKKYYFIYNLIATSSEIQKISSYEIISLK